MSRTRRIWRSLDDCGDLFPLVLRCSLSADRFNELSWHDLQTACHQGRSSEACRDQIKRAENTVQLGSVLIQKFQRFNGRKRGTLRYYRSLIRAFRSAGSSLLVKELDRVVSEIERLAGGQHPH